MKKKEEKEKEEMGRDDKARDSKILRELHGGHSLLGAFAVEAAASTVAFASLQHIAKTLLSRHLQVPPTPSLCVPSAWLTLIA